MAYAKGLKLGDTLLIEMARNNLNYMRQGRWKHVSIDPVPVCTLIQVLAV